MGIYASIISGIIQTGIAIYKGSQTPDYPNPPKLAKINIAGAQSQMEAYEAQRMQDSINAWKARFPLLYKGGAYEIGDIAKNQKGILSDEVKKSISNAGLKAPSEGDQYHQAVDLGLSPVTLAQRTSQAVTRQIALNPEWTNKISGGTLATMMANNYQNQNAFSQFLGAQNTAQYVAGQQRSAYNTQALTAGLLGTAQIGTQAYINQQQALQTNPLSSYSYRSDVRTPGYYVPSQQGSTTPYNGSAGSYPGSSMWGAPPPTSYMYGNSSPWGSGFGAYNLAPSPQGGGNYSQFATDYWNMYQPPAGSGLSLGGI